MQDRLRPGADRDDSPRYGADDGRLVAVALDGDRVARHERAGRLAALAAGRSCEQQQRSDREEERDSHATHCQSAHCATETPSRIELTATIAVCARGRPPTTASARKSGKIVRPKRGSESSGQRSLGHAQRDRQAERREQPVRRAEAPPGDHGQHDEEHEEGERLEVQHGDADRVGVLHRRPVDVRVRARRELLDSGPAGAQAVPDSAERAGRREVPAPEPLRVQELPGVALGDPEVERVDREEQRRDRQRGERPHPVALVPGEQREGRQQRGGGRSRQQRQPGDRARGEEAAALGQHEGGQRQQQVERLAVDGLQEEREREDGQVEHRPPGAVGAEPLLGDPVQEQKRAERGRERDEDPGEHVVPEEHAPEQRHRRRVERVERGRGTLRRAVAVLGDAQEPDAVPARPDVGDRAEVVRQLRIVPDGRPRVPVRHEDEEREQRRGPDRQARPEEDLGRGIPCARQPQFAAGRPLRQANALTGGHGAR